MFHYKHQWRGEDWVTAVRVYDLGNSCSYWQGPDSIGWCACPLTMLCCADLQSPEMLECYYIYTARKTAPGSFHRTSCREGENLTFQFETLFKYSRSPPVYLKGDYRDHCRLQLSWLIPCRTGQLSIHFGCPNCI